MDLFGAPRGMFATHLPNGMDPWPGRTIRRAFGPARTILQSRATLRSKTPQPLKARFAADADLTTELSDRVRSLEACLNKASARFPQRVNFPRHERRKPQRELQNRLPMSMRSPVTHVPTPCLRACCIAGLRPATWATPFRAVDAQRLAAH